MVFIVLKIKCKTFIYLLKVFKTNKVCTKMIVNIEDNLFYKNTNFFMNIGTMEEYF